MANVGRNKDVPWIPIQKPVLESIRLVFFVGGLKHVLSLYHSLPKTNMSNERKTGQTGCLVYTGYDHP